MTRGRELKGRGGVGLERRENIGGGGDAGEETGLQEPTILLRQPVRQY